MDVESSGNGATGMLYDTVTTPIDNSVSIILYRGGVFYCCAAIKGEFHALSFCQRLLVPCGIKSTQDVFEL